MSDTAGTPLFPEEPDEGTFVTVAKVGDIPEGQGRAFSVGKRMVAVFFHEGQYFAIDDFCPHQGASWLKATSMAARLLAHGITGDFLSLTAAG